jgi:hypothetical protein
MAFQLEEDPGGPSNSIAHHPTADAAIETTITPAVEREGESSKSSDLISFTSLGIDPPLVEDESEEDQPEQEDDEATDTKGGPTNVAEASEDTTKVAEPPPRGFWKRIIGSCK